MNITMDEGAAWNETSYHDAEPRYPAWLITLRGTIGLFIAIFGIVANCLTILALLKAKQLRNATTFFIVSMSVADLTLCCIGLMINITRYADLKWTEVNFLCTLVPLLLYANFGVSFLSVVMITFNRYVKIAHYTKYHNVYTWTKIGIMIAFCWIFSFSLQLPTLCGVWGEFGYNAKLRTCDIIADSRGRSSKQWIFIFSFFLPCVTIVFCYTRILYVVFMSSRRLNEALRTNVDEAQRKRSELKRMKMVFIIFITFLLCFLPIIVIKNLDKNTKYPGLHVLGHFLVNISACINPVIYGLTNVQYRQAYLDVLCVCRNSKTQSIKLQSSTELYSTSKSSK